MTMSTCCMVRKVSVCRFPVHELHGALGHFVRGDPQVVLIGMSARVSLISEQSGLNMHVGCAPSFTAKLSTATRSIAISSVLPSFFFFSSFFSSFSSFSSCRSSGRIFPPRSAVIFGCSLRYTLAASLPGYLPL